MTLRLHARHERWPLARLFTISRGSKTHADVVVVELSRNGHVGRGECVPYPRYNETVEGVLAALSALAPHVDADLQHAQIPSLGLPHAAANALDCALWDLLAREAGTSVIALLGLPPLQPRTTAYTISLDEPAAMAEAALRSGQPLLKLKLGREGDAARLRAVRAAVPASRLIVDANEGWTSDNLLPHLSLCAELGVELVEQPLPAGADEALRQRPAGVKVCADESAHGLDSLPDLLGKYDAINIKLDKTGGLTPALALAQAAQQQGLDIMVGCMVATSLAMAPAFIVAQQASVVDLDGPLLLAEDRADGIAYAGGVMSPPPPSLWS